MTIRVIKREAVEDEKWDGCVAASANGSAFVSTWFLDLICDDWEAIVLDDYDAVMPLPLRRQMGLKQVYHPSLLPYSGIVNRIPLVPDVVMKMIETVPYRNIHLVMNVHNRLPLSFTSKLQTYRYPVLDLISDLDWIEKHFRDDMHSIIELYQEKQLTVIRDLNVADYMLFLRQTIGIRDHEYAGLQHVMAYALRYKSAGMYAAYDKNNQMIAGAFLLKSNGCLALLHCMANDDNYSGVKAIIYHVLKYNAGSNLTLEFPFCAHEVGSCFTSKEHVCLVYKKGLSKWIDL